MFEMLLRELTLIMAQVHDSLMRLNDGFELRLGDKDLHFVMAGGDPCKVCAKVCMMGEGNCQPVWTGEKTV